MTLCRNFGLRTSNCASELRYKDLIPQLATWRYKVPLFGSKADVKKILNKRKSRPQGKRMELSVPTVSDVVFKYTWPIKRYMRVVTDKIPCDSPPFSLNINGIRSKWNLSIRFWMDPQGRSITNPVVLCLNVLNCSVEEVEIVTIRFQFGIYNAETKQWEFCHSSRAVLELKKTSDILSLGYKDLCIVDRHVDKTGDVRVIVKIQIIRNGDEKQNFSQQGCGWIYPDTARPMRYPRVLDRRLSCDSVDNIEVPVHNGLIGIRRQSFSAKDQFKINESRLRTRMTEGSDDVKISPEVDGPKEVRRRRVSAL